MAGLRAEYMQAKSYGNPSQLDSSISQRSSCQMPQSALRSGKYDTSNSKLNALKFDLSEIHDTYGYDASLYHVLSINRNASASEIKAAYLNKGREILLEGGNPSQRGSGVSDKSRKKFQAISLAYEILSKEDLRALYDGRCSVARKNSVQWSKVVQEKVIKDAHPNEHSHRRYPRRAPPVYEEDACSGLDDEFDEMMFYCNDDGNVNFIELEELRAIVDSFNSSMKTKKTHLLESFEMKLEADRQPSEEMDMSEGEDLRQQPAESADALVIQTHKGDPTKHVCDTAEETIFPVPGKASKELDLEKSSVAIAVIAATAVAAALSEIDSEAAAKSSSAECFTCGDLELFADDDEKDIIEAETIQEQVPNGESANDSCKCEPDDVATNRKAKQTTEAKEKTSCTKSKRDTNTNEKSTTDVTATNVATAAAGASAGWFGFFGTSEEVKSDEAKQTDECAKLNNAEVIIDNDECAAVVEGNKKRMSAAKFRKAVATRIKSKPRVDTKCQSQPAEVTAESAAGISAGWFFCCGASEILANDSEDEVAKTNVAEKKVEATETVEAKEKDVVEDGLGSEADEAVNKKMIAAAKLRKAVASRMKPKSLAETEAQILPAEVTTESAAETSTGWFGTEKKVETADTAEAKEKVVTDGGLGSGGDESTVNKKIIAAAKFRKAVASRMKPKSLLDTEDQGQPSETATESAAETSTGWFGKEKKVEATETVEAKEKDVVEDGLGGEATVNKKMIAAAKLRKAVASRMKPKSLAETEAQILPAEVTTESAAETSTGWFGTEKKVEATKTVEAKEKVVVEEGLGGDADEAAVNKKMIAAAKLRKAVTSRMKPKSLLNTEDQGSPAEIATDATPETSTGWFATNVAERKVEETNTTEMGDKVVLKKGLSGGDEESIGSQKKMSTAKLRMAMVSRMKSKSRRETEDQGPPAEIRIEAAAETSTGWFGCCGASEALANGYEDEDTKTNVAENKICVADMAEAKEKIVLEEGLSGKTEEGSVNKRMVAAAKLRKAMVGRVKPQSLLDGEVEEGSLKSNSSRSLLKPLSIRSRLNKNDKADKRQSNDRTEAHLPIEEEEIGRSGILCCCAAPATEPTPINEVILQPM